MGLLSSGGGMRALRPDWLAARAFLVASVFVAFATPAIAQGIFPFDQEMLLDVRPLAGSRRVPMIEVAPDGGAQISLWCHDGSGQVQVTGDAIKFTLGPMSEENCTPERTQRDEELATALAQVTQWRMEDDVVVLAGPMELRFRLSTH
jgi:heat shock protein HslJ